MRYLMSILTVTSSCAAICIIALIGYTSALAADPRVHNHEIRRNADGTIHRDQKQVYAFRKEWPCPVTGKTWGACKGWAVDHVIPLACNGVDEVINMQWLPDSIKSAAGTDPKDRWERKIYCNKDQ